MKVLTELWNTVTSLLGMVLMTAVMSLFIGALFAPLLEKLLFPEVFRRGTGANCANLEEILEAGRRVTQVRIALWITALLAWTFLIVTNLFYWRIIR